MMEDPVGWLSRFRKKDAPAVLTSNTSVQEGVALEAVMTTSDALIEPEAVLDPRFEGFKFQGAPFAPLGEWAYAPVVPTEVMGLTMDDDEPDWEVVGESHYLAGISRIKTLIEADRSSGEGSGPLYGMLVAEPGNPHSKSGSAVRVDLVYGHEREKCGYLPNDESAKWQPAVKSAADKGLLVFVRAVLSGGTDDRPNLGVWLTGTNREVAAIRAERKAPVRDLTVAEEWVNVEGVGDYQRLLSGRVPRPAEVELFAWDRGEGVTARIDGERVGEMPSNFVSKAHAALRARRQAGLEPVYLTGEIRRGDYVPAYLAVKVPGYYEVESWARSLAPEGWSRPREKEEYPYFSTAKQYQEALAVLFAKYSEATRGLKAEVAFMPRPAGKNAGELMGVVSRDGLVITEFDVDHERWAGLYSDHVAGNVGRLLVSFSQSSNGKYRASGVYKVPAPAAAKAQIAAAAPSKQGVERFDR